MTASFLLASAYLGQLGLKAELARRYARKVGRPMKAAEIRTVTILQPILSGDPALPSALAANVAALPTAKFLWLVDEDDPAGAAIAREVAGGFSRADVRVLTCGVVPQGVNPKAHKLARALPEIDTPVFVVLDDDTRLGETALAALLAGLETGATLATGLPRYHAADGQCSSWLAEFVNSAAVLSYLPALNFTAPLTIHGMCYAMRTDEARRLDVFNAIRRSLTDDLALALELRRKGLGIYQTTEPHDIATSVDSWPALGQILKRWFVFSRLLVAACRWPVRLGIGVAYVMPPLLLVALMLAAMRSLTAAAVVAVAVVGRDLVLRGMKARFLGGEVPHRAWASLALELAQPGLLAVALGSRTIRWRSRRIRVRTVDDFEYV